MADTYALAAEGEATLLVALRPAVEKMTPRRRVRDHPGVENNAMTLTPSGSPVKPAASRLPAVRSFGPDDPAPSGRAAAHLVPPHVHQAGPTQIQVRVRLLWADPKARAGQREEVVRLADPRKVLDLLRRIDATPDRTLLGARFEVMARPRWYEIPLDYVRMRAAQRDRRDEIKIVMERRAAERKGGAR